MAKYHLNHEGNPGVCRATKSCPLGGDSEHYPSKGDARTAFERRAEVTEIIYEQARTASNRSIDLGAYDWIETVAVGSEEWKDQVEWLEGAIAECRSDGDEDGADAYDTMLCAIRQGEAHWNHPR